MRDTGNMCTTLPHYLKNCILLYY